MTLLLKLILYRIVNLAIIDKHTTTNHHFTFDGL